MTTTWLLYLKNNKILKLSFLFSSMETTKETTTEQKNNILENGTYSVYGPDSGEIQFDTLELHAGSGAKRIWKVKSITEKEIILEIKKFG